MTRAHSCGICRSNRRSDTLVWVTQPIFRPKLDRIARFDDRSRGYAIRPFLGPSIERKKTIWDIPKPLPLNQGREGACVGFGWSGELAVGPIHNPADNGYAMALYADARAQDRRDGVDYTSGATVLAGAKVAKNRGLISGYRWAFGTADVIDTICSKGPVVLGTNWYDGMYETDRGGLLRVSGPLVGGHCWLGIGYWPAHPQFGDCIVLLNSWGPKFGLGGTAFLRVMELDYLLKQDGEACIANEIAPKPKRNWLQRVGDTIKDWTARD